MEKFTSVLSDSRVIIILFLLTIAPTIFAAQTKSAGVLLEEGQYAEAAGNIDEAIKIYQQIILSSGQRQGTAAQAEYRIGLCYLKKGDEEREVQQFRELISKYPKQKSTVSEAQRQLNSLRTPGPEDYVLEILSRNNETLYMLEDKKPSGLQNFGWKTFHNRNNPFFNSHLMVVFQFSADEKKAAREFIKLCSNFEGITLLRVTEPNNPLRPFERLPMDIVMNSGLVPYKALSILNDTWPFLDLDRSDGAYDENGPDIVFKNKLETISKYDRNSSVKILSLPKIQTWKEAITSARNMMPELEKSTLQSVGFDNTNQGNFFAVLTSENNLAVVQVDRNSLASRTNSVNTTEPNADSISWWLEKIPVSETNSKVPEN